MRKNIFIISFVVLIGAMSVQSVYAGKFGLGGHMGYGAVKYSEDLTASGSRTESKSVQPMFIFGLSGEYSVTEKYYLGLTTDWGIGFGSGESWRRNGSEYQDDEMKLGAEFYDVRLGYKKDLDSLYYRVYASGGWDGLHFRRENFKGSGVTNRNPGPVTEDFSLWRAGGGLNLGYKMGKFALDGKASYSYYFKGTVENSAWTGTEWETNGTCLDLGLGLVREINDKTKFYIGVMYSLISLDNDVKTVNGQQVTFPDSETEIIGGIISVTQSF